MVKALENRLKKLVKNSDPQKINDTLLKYTKEALDDIYKNNNAEEGQKKLETSIKFMTELIHSPPPQLKSTVVEIIDYWIEMLTKWLEKSCINYEINKMLLMANLISLNMIKTCINDFKTKREDKDLDEALKLIEISNELVFKYVDQDVIDIQFDKIKKEVMKSNSKEMDDITRKLESEIENNKKKYN